MQRKAQQYGCITDYDESDQLLLISHKGVHLTAINPEGFMHYNSKDLTDPESREVFMHLVDDAETVREYVGLYESAPQMKPKDVQNYRKLSEYGDVVFAGMYSQKHGFMFCSWRQSDGGRYLAHGDYSPDYLSSKENFAVRAGLVDNNKLFTKEEAEELFKCAAFARDNCESLTYEQDRGLMELMEKIQTAYPHLKDNPPTFDDGENPILLIPMQKKLDGTPDYGEDIPETNAHVR